MQKQNKGRKPIFGILIGTNGTGKSTFAKKLAEYRMRALYIPSSPADDTFNEIQVLEPGESIHEFAGVRRTYITAPESFANFCNSGIKDCLIVLDDVKNYVSMRGGRIDKNLEVLLRNRRHNMNDIFLIVHHPKDLHPDLLSFDPVLIFFKTTGSFNPALSTKLNYEELLEINRKVEFGAKKDPYFHLFVKM
jgi:hypothetical protein